MEVAIAPYRLLFNQPFGTAHGMRDGTDSVFVRVRRGGVDGYGEATLPPYLEETQEGVLRILQSIDIQDCINRIMMCFPAEMENDPLRHLPAARTALTTACYDLMARERGLSIASLFQVPAGGMARAMVTIGHCGVDEIPGRIAALPRSALPKVKLGGPHDIATVRRILELDQRPLFLDANQGWASVQEAMAIVEQCGEERLAGIEQPFHKDRWDLHQELAKLTTAPVYADESIQGPEELERAQGAFSGVNIKLMKCGGLDVAHRMARRARELGLEVMLGSMSESSLGCAAMAQLQPLAGLTDLDGPWLLRNDPFEGLGLHSGRLVVKGIQGTGVALRTGLDSIHFGA